VTTVVPILLERVRLVQREHSRSKQERTQPLVQHAWDVLRVTNALTVEVRLRESVSRVHTERTKWQAQKVLR